MIRLWYRHRVAVEPNTCTFQREGTLVLLLGLAQLETSTPVELRILCCRPRDKHLYRAGVYALRRNDSSTWSVEYGPHVVQDEFTKPVSDSILVSQVPEALDLFEHVTRTRWAA